MDFRASQDSFFTPNDDFLEKTVSFKDEGSVSRDEGFVSGTVELIVPLPSCQVDMDGVEDKEVVGYDEGKFVRVETDDDDGKSDVLDSVTTSLVERDKEDSLEKDVFESPEDPEFAKDGDSVVEMHKFDSRTTEHMRKKLEATHGAYAEEDPVSPTENRIADGEPSEESETVAFTEQMTAVHPQHIRDAGDKEGGEPEADESYFVETESRADFHSSSKESEDNDGRIVIYSEDDDDAYDEGGGKELFDSSALTAILRAIPGVDLDGDTFTINSQNGPRLLSVERPAARLNVPGLFSTSRPNSAESQANLSEEEKRKLEKLQQMSVKFLRLVHRLGLSPEEPMAEQVLYKLGLLGGRLNSNIFSLYDAKKLAMELEAEGKDDLDFSVNILVLGKNGVGKSATINSLFEEEKSPISSFEVGTPCATQVCGFIDGVKVKVIDTPGLRASAMEQAFNSRILSSVKKLTKKTPPDVVLYVDRLNAQNRDLDDLPLLKTITKVFGSSIWRTGIVTLTHAASAPPDGYLNVPLSYNVFVSRRSSIVQQAVRHAVGDLQILGFSMNPVSLVENHRSCRRNRDGQKILPNGQSWRAQLLLQCYSMKILSEASSLQKPNGTFDPRKLFDFRFQSPPLLHMLSSMLKSRSHPMLQPDLVLENADSDIEQLDSEDKEEDEYDQLPSFTPLTKDEVAMLSREQKKAYFDEYDYREKLLHKKQWKEELRRIKEIRKMGKSGLPDYGYMDDYEDPSPDPDPVPLPDRTLPPTFDGDNPTYRYRSLQPTSQFIAQPVAEENGWDHDCGYDGVNIEHSFAIANLFPVSYTFQANNDKEGFTFSFDSAASAKIGDMLSAMANLNVQSIGNKRAYVLRAESKLKKMKNHKAGGGISITVLDENIVPGFRVEDHISFGKRYSLLGSAGAVKSSQDGTSYGANIELQRREIDYPIGRVQSSASMSVFRWRGDTSLALNALAQFAIGRNSEMAVRAGVNKKCKGQISVRMSSSDHLSIALTAAVTFALTIYKKLWPSPKEK